MGIYQISVAVEDSGDPVLGAHQEFALTVVDGGQIETGALEVFQPDARPVDGDLSVRLSASA